MLEKSFLNSITSPSIAHDTTSTLHFSKDSSKNFNSDSRFVPTNRHNPCPVCDRDDGACRIQGDLIHCFTYADARLKDVVSDYICVKTASGHTATFKELDSKFESQPKKFVISRTPTVVAGSVAETESVLSLSLEERDTHYRRLLGMLSLNQSDREELRSRGLNDSQIDSGMFRSIEKYHKLDACFPANLPGIVATGIKKSKIIVSGDGILCPILQNGLIVGFENRQTHLKEGDKNRYKLLSSDGSIKIQGELPIPYISVSTEQKRVYAVEGKGMKPNVLALRHGVGVVGYGRHMHLNLIQTDRILALLDKESEIVLCLDAGDVLNKFVYEKWIAEYEFLQAKGFKTYFGWWEQATKNDCDIDNLDSLDKIELIDLQALQALIKNNYVAAKEAFVEKQKDADKQNWLARRKFTPDIVINSDEKYFKFPENLPTENAIISVKAGMGTGKTEASFDEILCTDNKKGSLWIGYRNTLLTQSVQRATNKKISMTLIKGMARQDIHALLESNDQQLALCLDSIEKVDGHFEGRDLYIDESCSVLAHGINGGTLKNRQAKTLAIFQKAIRECRRVFLLDGNQSDFFTGIVAELAPEKKVIKIQKESRLVPQNFVFIEGFDNEKQVKKAKDTTAMINMLTQINGKVFGFSDSRMQTNILGKMFTALGKKGNVLNQDTVCDPWAKLFLNDPDKFIEETRPDFHINSPTADSGLSVDIKGYFEAKFSFFNGVIVTNSQTQSLERLRDKIVTHFISCQERAVFKDPKIPFYFHVQAINDSLMERATISALLATHTANSPESVKDIVLEKMSENMNNVFCKASFVIMTMENYERANLRDCLIHILKENGHNVEIIQLDTSKNTKDEVSEIKAEILEEEAHNIFKAEPLDDDEYERYKNESPNRETAYRVQKTKILKTLPNIQNEDCFNEKFILEYWLNRNSQKIWQHDLFVLFNNVEIARKRHEASTHYVFTKQDFFIPSFIDYKPLRLETLRSLNIEQFLDLSKEWCKTDPQVIELYETIKNSDDLAKKLNYRLPVEQHNEQHFIANLKEILGWFGIKFKKPTQKLNNKGEKVRYYQIDDEHFNSPERLAIIKALEAKHNEWLLSDKAKIDWISDEKHSEILADSLRKATSYEQACGYEQAWFRQILSDPNNFESESQKYNNDRIHNIVARAWSLLSFEEVLRIKSLSPLENPDVLLKKVDELILKKLPDYSIELLHAQTQTKLWRLRLDQAIEFGKGNATLIYRLAENALGAALKAVVNQVSGRAKEVYTMLSSLPIEHVSMPTSVPVKQQQLVKNVPDEITEDNILTLAANCESIDEAIGLVIKSDEFGKLGACLHMIGDCFRRQILDTSKYLHIELRKCYFTFYYCFINDIPMIEEI